MKSLFGGFLYATGAVALAVGVLAGLERLLENPSSSRRQGQANNTPAVAESEDETAALDSAATLAPKADAERNFSIKRTKSEVGYVYWILEGYGKYKCFILCDSWDEAVAQAKAKLAEVDGVDAPQPGIAAIA
jgi:hypothetical protein